MQDDGALEDARSAAAAAASIATSTSVGCGDDDDDGSGGGGGLTAFAFFLRFTLHCVRGASERKRQRRGGAGEGKREGARRRRNVCWVLGPVQFEPN